MKTVFFDLETAGLVVGDAIIQFGGIAVDESWKEVEVLELKIQFDKATAQPRALEVNHYTDEAWEAAVPEAHAVMQIAAFFGRHADVQLRGARPPFRPYSVATGGGHNVVGFDIVRLSHLFKEHGAFLPLQFTGVLDTLSGAAWYFKRHPELPRPADFKLSTLAAYFKIDASGAHEALADVRMSVALARIFAE